MLSSFTLSAGSKFARRVKLFKEAGDDLGGVQRSGDDTGCRLGYAIVRGSRVQADTIVESYELGESVEEIAYSFDLDPKDIREILSFAACRAALKTTA